MVNHMGQDIIQDLRCVHMVTITNKNKYYREAIVSTGLSGERTDGEGDEETTSAPSGGPQRPSGGRAQSAGGRTEEDVHDGV